MKSRRVHRVRTAQRQAQGVLETYQQSSRGLMRVFTSILPGGDPSAAAARRASHHLAEVEALLPRIREAIRSCRYPGAEKGDATALLWGLWGQLSEAQLHLRGALESLEVLGRFARKASQTSARAAAGTASAPRRRKGKPKKKAGRKVKKETTKKAAKRTTKKKATKNRSAGPARAPRTGGKSGRKPAGGRKSGPRSGR